MNASSAAPSPSASRRGFRITASAILAGHLVLAIPTVLPGAEPPRDGQTPVPASSTRVTLSGEVPRDDFPDIQERSDTIWSHIERRFAPNGDHPAPEVHFSPFDRSTQSPDWTVWQKAWTRTHPVIWRDWTALRLKGSKIEISPQWIDANIDEIFPFPKTFLAFHYDGTNRIQINPRRTFLEAVQLDPYGIRRDMDGRGYYTLAHEMLHYALELDGVVPTKLHHCLMLYTKQDADAPALMEQLADYLVERRMIAAGARHRWLTTERSFDPCGELTPDEQHQVDRFFTRLAPAHPGN